MRPSPVGTLSPVRGFRRARIALALVLVPPLCGPAATAATSTNVFFFGDSLTDTGVFGPGDVGGLDLVGSYGYDADRWTNAGGTLWAEHFAAALGHSASSRTFGGTNYARGGARTDELAGQIAQFSVDYAGVADPGALYVVWAGGNDMLQGRSTSDAANGLIAAINQLSALGAVRFLVGNVKDSGPFAPGTGPLASIAPIPPNATAWATAYATELPAALSTLSGVSIYLVDFKGLLDPIVADPAAYGFSAGLDLCVNDPDCVAGIGVDDHLMFDHVHLTSAGHGLVAQAALAVLPACPASPAPSCIDGFHKASLRVTERRPGKEKLHATFSKGPRLGPFDFGDPTATAGTSVAFCVYDDAGALTAALEVDRAGESCGERPCWRSFGGAPTGFRYGDPAGTAAGVRSLTFATGAGGHSSFSLFASNRARKGQTGLPGGIAGALSETGSATLQLHTSNAECFAAVVDDVLVQESDRFKAR